MNESLKFNCNVFKQLIDDNNNNSNIVLLLSPFNNENDYNKYLEGIKKGFKFIGCFRSYMFTTCNNNLYKDNWDKYNYFKLCFGWFYSFPNSELFINNYPKTLIDINDFINVDKINYNKNIEKEYDFICFVNSNNNSFMYYINLLCKKYKMNGLLFSNKDFNITLSGCHLIKIKNINNFKIYFNELQKCRFVFLPETINISSTIISNSICLNLPCLVSKKILDGINYINDKTGLIFNQDENENDFDSIIKNFQYKYHMFSPRQYYINNYGNLNQGKKIVNFIKTNIPNYKQKINLNLR